MGEKIMRVTPELLVDLLKAPGDTPRTWTIQGPLPEDARLVKVVVDWDGRYIGCILSSSEWPEALENEYRPEVRPVITVHMGGAQ